MSPQLNVVTNESSGSGGIPTGTGTVFVAGVTDAGPPPTSPGYVKCQSMTDFINSYGPRSSTSATIYDFLDDFFQEGGQSGKAAYVTRVTDNSATTAALTLNDAGSEPTVTVSALTAGLEGNDTFVTATTGTGTTFTANTTSSSPTLASVSSFAGIGVGTPVTGTGIPSNTFISAVNATAATATMNKNATATGSGVTITPGTVTVIVVAEDSSGDQLADETHGPYYTTAQLFADTTSTWVSFAQASGGGATVHLPVALTQTALTGGADADDVTDASHVTALANFPGSLGPGTVCLPGKTSTTAWQGIRDHANAKNRWGILDMTDASNSAAVISQVTGIGSGDWTRCFFIQGSVVVPGASTAPTVSRTVPGSATVAALAAQVANGNNQALVPAGKKWGLTYAEGFTEYFGPLPATNLPAGAFSQSDVNAMETAGVNCFANFYGNLCLFGFVTPVSSSQDLIYDQANATRERMALVNDAQNVMADYLFDEINLATLQNLNTDLNAVGLNHTNAKALLGCVVNVGAPVNTSTTAEAKQLNAQLSVQIPRYADTVNTTITVIPVTVSLPAASS